MITIITDIGLLINNPYTVVVLAYVCFLFRNTLADMFSCCVSKVNSFFALIYRLTLFAAGMFACAFYLMFNQGVIVISDKFITLLFVMCLLMLAEMLVVLTKSILMLFCTAFNAEKKVFAVCDDVVSCRQNASDNARVRVFRLLQ